MENPRGRVIAVKRVESLTHALVEVDSAIQCARCAQGKGCGAGLMGGSPASRRVDALIAAGLSVGQGDEVRIELGPRNILQASLIVYGAPLSGAIVAALVAFAAGLDDLYAVLAAMAGLTVGLLLARIRLQKASCLRRFRPVIVERIISERPLDGRLIDARVAAPNSPISR